MIGAIGTSGKVTEQAVTLGDYATVEVAASIEAGNTIIGEGTTVGVGSKVGAGAVIGKVCFIFPQVDTEEMLTGKPALHPNPPHRSPSRRGHPRFHSHLFQRNEEDRQARGGRPEEQGAGEAD